VLFRSAERSAALIKDLEKNQVDPDFLIAAAYPSTQPEIGFKIKTHKTIIVIENMLAAPSVATKQDTAPATKASTTVPVAPQTQPKAIPIQPAQPKTN
jgi:hypothetical protein